MTSSLGQCSVCGEWAELGGNVYRGGALTCFDCYARDAEFAGFQHELDTRPEASAEEIVTAVRFARDWNAALEPSRRTIENAAAEIVYEQLVLDRSSSAES